MTKHLSEFTRNQLAAMELMRLAADPSTLARLTARIRRRAGKAEVVDLDEGPRENVQHGAAGGRRERW